MHRDDIIKPGLSANFITIYKRVFSRTPKKALAITMHWQNTGHDIVTSSAATWQRWFGAGLFLLSIN